MLGSLLYQMRHLLQTINTMQYWHCLVLWFWWNFEFTKFSQYLAETFGKLPSPWAICIPTKEINREITHTMFYKISIFVNILKLIFFPKFWKMMQNFWKIQSFVAEIFAKLALKYWRNFPRFGVATNPIVTSNEAKDIRHTFVSRLISIQRLNGPHHGDIRHLILHIY